MSPTFDVRHISVSIDRAPQEVYAFVAPKDRSAGSAFESPNAKWTEKDFAALKALVEAR
jgi:hypothetical protein